MQPIPSYSKGMRPNRDMGKGKGKDPKKAIRLSTGQQGCHWHWLDMATLSLSLIRMVTIVGISHL